jgi:TRAP-type C4-dicarboxylate transport system permease small subunit
MIEGMGALLFAFLTRDSFEISGAIWHWSAYPFFAIVMVLGGGFLLGIFRLVPIMDAQFERVVLIGTYLVIALVIFVEVIRRFVFQLQAPWSTTLPPYLFLVMSWMGCAYNARIRTHLAFGELRMALPRHLQFMCLCLDMVLWLGFALIVLVTTMRQTVNSASNFQILLGTDDVMQWWFYACVPLSWLILSARVVENFWDDCVRYVRGDVLVRQQSLLGD